MAQSSGLVILNWRDWTHPRAGGAEYYLKDIAEASVRAGSRVTMLVQAYPGSRSEQELDGIRILRGGNTVTGYLFAARTLQKMLRIDPTLQVIESVNTIPFLSYRFTKRRIVLLHHLLGKGILIETPFPLSAGLYMLERQLSHYTGDCVVITISDQSRQELIAAGFAPERVRVVHPGTPLAVARMERAPVGRNGHRICYVGRLTRYKGLLDLVDAVPMLKREFGDVKLIIAGQGYLEAELRDRVRLHHVEEAVEIRGFVSEAEKLELISSSSLFGHPTASDGGWSLSVLEALVRGVPAIVTSELQEMVGSDRGSVVEWHAPEMIARSVARYWNEPKLLEDHSRNAFEWARQFSSDRSASEVRSFLGSGDSPGSQ